MLTAIIPHPNGDDFRAEIHGDTRRELSQNVRTFIMFEGYGASDIGALFNVYREGNIVATVSYNGRFDWRDSLYADDPAAQGEATAREDNIVIHGRCISDEDLADELENLTQDEAAELAETIEAERAKAINELRDEPRPLSYWKEN